MNEIQEKEAYEQEIRDTHYLRVWYGLRRTTAKVKRQAVLIVYENCNYNHNGNLKRVERWMNILFTRLQTESEKQDVGLSNRMFSAYEYYFDDKKYKKDPEKLIEAVLKGEPKEYTSQEIQKLKEILTKNIII